MDNTKKALISIADKINARRRAELMATDSGADGLLKKLHQVRESGIYNHGDKERNARLFASIPTTYFKFFEDLYESRTGSRKFYEDTKFMRENCSQFLTVHKKDL